MFKSEVLMPKSKVYRTPPVQVLNDNELDSWSEKIERFLKDYKNWVLQQLKQQEKRDGSASPDVLASIGVINRVFPCPVELYQMNSFKLLRFRLGKGPFEFVVKKEENEHLKFIVNSGSNTYTSTAYDQKTQDFWTVIPDGKSVEMNFLTSMFRDVLNGMLVDEKNMLIEIRQQTLNKIGFRTIMLPIPTGEPDIRIQAVTRRIDEQFIHLNPNHLVDDMEKCSCLLMVCPDEINQVMQRARLLYVHAYSEWEFFTISVHYAVLALEASVRAIYDKWLGNENVEVTATVEEKPIIEMISGPRENILKWANREKAFNVKVKGLPLPRNKQQLLEHTVRIGALSKWEKEKCNQLLELRDTFSHPVGTFTNWISSAFNDIQESCLLINLMWARFYKHITL
jgi:hypothetical protein